MGRQVLPMRSAERLVVDALILEFAGDYPFAHALEHRQSRVLAAAAHEFAECRCKRCFGQDLRLDTPGGSFGPGFILAFQRSQPFFLADSGVDFDEAACHILTFDGDACIALRICQ